MRRYHPVYRRPAPDKLLSDRTRDYATLGLAGVLTLVFALLLYPAGIGYLALALLELGRALVGR